MPHPHPAGQVLTSRRKRALDETNFTTHDATANDAEERDRTMGRVQRQRTSSTTSVETIRVRPTSTIKNIVGLGVGKPLVALTLPKPLPQSSSVGSKIPIPIPTSTVKSTTPPPRKSILKKPKLANLGAAAQTVPIVAHQHEPVVVDGPRGEEDMDMDAELLKLQMDMDMDMDAIPSIPSPPDSPPLRATDAPRDSTVRNAPAPPPPATSTSTQTSVSTVKGTKKRPSTSKTKTPSISFPSIDAKAKSKGKPLVALSSNTHGHGRSSSKSSSHTRTNSKSSPPSTKEKDQAQDAKQPLQPQNVKSTAKIDKWGCVHLGAADCMLKMTFPQPHCEVWDMRDDVCIACPAILHLTPKDPARWDVTPLSMPDVSLMDIQCSVIVPTSSSAHDPNASYHTQFMGAEIGPTSKDCPPKVPEDSITVEGRWVRASSYPPTDAKKRDDLSSSGKTNNKTKHKSRNSLAQALGLDLDLDIIPEPTSHTSSKEHPERSTRGWFLKIWIPIPTRLFVKKETRIFKVVAKVWMMGDEDRDFTYLDGEQEGDGLVDKDTLPLVGVGEMTVSHLRGERMFG